MYNQCSNERFGFKSQQTVILNHLNRSDSVTLLHTYYCRMRLQPLSRSNKFPALHALHRIDYARFNGDAYVYIKAFIVTRVL